ncbi:MAG: 4Fe-4S ferredoxin [Spirochaetes bacterium RBG_16_49_21]|nr:MAG: 4Fe-4S ferredoxin [Spirochaetes bacterium RBG_16_49_21]
MNGCPGSQVMDFRGTNEAALEATGDIKSQLKQWPIQLHLISPSAPYYSGADVVLAADCVAYAYGGFHSKFLKDRSIAIACPKLDEGQDAYVEKITALFEDARINTLTVITMQVPCCRGLLALAQDALGKSGRKAPTKHIVISLQGDVLQEDWI